MGAGRGGACGSGCEVSRSPRECAACAGGRLEFPPSLLPSAWRPAAAKEIERLQKQHGKLEKELAALQGRLGNRAFVDKAPEQVVAEVRAAAAEAAEQLAMIQDKVAKFKELA